MIQKPAEALAIQKQDSAAMAYSQNSHRAPKESKYARVSQISQGSGRKDEAISQQYKVYTGETNISALPQINTRNLAVQKKSVSQVKTSSAKDAILSSD